MADPEDRWLAESIAELRAMSARLAEATERLNQKCTALNARLKAVEAAKGRLIGLGLGLIASIAGCIYWAGGVAAEARRAAEDRVALKELAKEFHEHERRSSTPKPEGR